MDDETRKILTEYLEEEWHENVDELMADLFDRWVRLDNRYFFTPDDLMAVFEKLVESGDWNRFFNHTQQVFLRSTEAKANTECVCDDCEGYFAWLFSRLPDGTFRLCELAGEWLRKEEKIK